MICFVPACPSELRVANIVQEGIYDLQLAVQHIQYPAAKREHVCML